MPTRSSRQCAKNCCRRLLTIHQRESDHTRSTFGKPKDRLGEIREAAPPDFASLNPGHAASMKAASRCGSRVHRAGVGCLSNLMSVSDAPRMRTILATIHGVTGSPNSSAANTIA